MKLSEFYKSEYRISYVNCLRQYWRGDRAWSCMGKPKELNLLLYFDGCSARYTLKSGEKFTAGDGDAVFCPVGSEYSVEFFGFKNKNSGTVGINFKIFSDTPPPDCTEHFSPFLAHSEVAKIESLDRRSSDVPMKYNTALAEIITLLGENSDSTDSRDFGIIKSGRDYLCEHIYEDISVEELARMCNISDVYFRRIFKEKTGYSPVKYRLLKRFDKAEEYLKYTENSVRQIAELLGFSDPSYFIKKFKEIYGCTPLAYRAGFLIN